MEASETNQNKASLSFFEQSENSHKQTPDKRKNPKSVLEDSETPKIDRLVTVWVHEKPPKNKQ